MGILQNFTRQGAFDIMVKHLREQQACAMLGRYCSYRAPDGKKCAVGALIPDSAYRESFEGKSPMSTTMDPVFGHLSDEDRAFLADCQSALHDDHKLQGKWPPEAFEEAVHRIARRWNLQVPA